MIIFSATSLVERQPGEARSALAAGLPSTRAEPRLAVVELVAACTQFAKLLPVRERQHCDPHPAAPVPTTTTLRADRRCRRKADRAMTAADECGHGLECAVKSPAYSSDSTLAPIRASSWICSRLSHQPIALNSPSGSSK